MVMSCTDFFAVHPIRQLTALNQDSLFENFLEDAVIFAGKRFIYSYLMVSVKLIKITIAGLNSVI
jgi:hypothetical protein